MSPQLLSSSLAAGFVFSLIVSAQAPAQQSPASPAEPPTTTTEAQKDALSPESITVSGCVLQESRVLKPGAMAGATMSAGDGYVLTQAKLKDSSTAMEKPEADGAAPPSEPVGTSGSENSFGKVYRLTGDKDNALKNYVGQRVDIVGMFKHEEDAKTEAGAVGTSGHAGDLSAANTPEITISSITPSTGSCSVPTIK